MKLFRDTLLCSALPVLATVFFSASLYAAPASDVTIAASPDRYNVIWDSPSKDASGQMPLGNGDIAAGVYAIEDGNLYLLLSKNDAYTYSGDIFKTARARITITPNPFTKGKAFRQTLDLNNGAITINAGEVKLCIWADANRPIYHVQAVSPQKISVSASFESWKRFDACRFNVFDATGTNTPQASAKNPTQDVQLERDGHLLTYYGVGDRSIYASDLDYYGVPEFKESFPDPFRHNTFGNLLESPNLKLIDGKLTGEGSNFDIRIHALTQQCPDPESWIKAIVEQAHEKRDTLADWKSHCQWWADFWNRSWIHVADNTLPLSERGKLNGEATKGRRVEEDGGALVAQSYNVFRYIMACQSRGKIQAKFNGGLFTQPRHCGGGEKIHKIKQPNGTWLTHEDSRLWGRRYTFQNQRLLYWPLLMSGDLDEMLPFFNYYNNLLPIRKAITKAWFGHEGAYFRENIEPTGAERDNGKSGKPPKTKPGENKGKGYYHSYYFTCGLETVTMMIEYAKYSEDEKFSNDVLVPFAREVLMFFDKHYGRDPDGKIRLDPAMVLETWWIAVNPSPDIAGLQHCLDQLLTMQVGTEADKTTWKRFSTEIPPLNLREIGGRQAIAPAYEWKLKKNAENGTLYPVFPFPLFGLAHGTEDIVEWTMKHRVSKNAFGFKCWTQDQIDWAYAGKAKEAADGLVHRFRHASTQCRFPLYGSAGPDSCPDFDHFGSGSTALQRMLVQESGDRILLLPAWPAKWDTEFKLHLSHKTVVTGKVVKGKLTQWDITPASRKKDVKVYPTQ